MISIGIPTETKSNEGRVVLTPPACQALVQSGHEVFIQSGAGDLSGFSDAAYVSQGVRVEPNAEALYAAATLIVKVKEPTDQDVQHLRAHHILFCYLHLAALPDLTQQLCTIGLTAIGFETVLDKQGRLPLLAPMSDIAGRVGMQVAAHYLHQPLGGKGKLLGGIAGTPRGHVVIVGCGVAGFSALKVAVGLGAQVTVFDKKMDQLERARSWQDSVTALYPHPQDVQAAIASADILIGAVLVPGAKAPNLVSKDWLETMPDGGVVVDIAVDQGGCIETTRPTTYADPVYKEVGLTHFCVTNIPGAVPQTASTALSSAIMPYVESLSKNGVPTEPDVLGLHAGINVQAGDIKLSTLI